MKPSKMHSAFPLKIVPSGFSRALLAMALAVAGVTLRVSAKEPAGRSVPRCEMRFHAPPDTALPEGASLKLVGLADCAEAYSWAAVSGPAPRILDPETKVLQISLPRVAGDTTIVYRFTATFAAFKRNGYVRVRVREAIPDPVFTLRDTMWNGTDPLLLRPEIANGVELRSKGASLLNYAWSISGTADSAWGDGGLTLTHPEMEGEGLRVGLCLDDGGAPVCRSAAIRLSPLQTVGAGRGALGGRGGSGARGASNDRGSLLRDACGRRLSNPRDLGGLGEGFTSPRAFPLPGR